MTLRRLLRRIPLPLKMALLALALGGAAGVGTTLYVGTVVSRMFEGHLQELLEKQSREDRLAFDHHVKSFHQVARLTVLQQSFHSYMESADWFRNGRECRIFADEMPPWFLNRSALRSLAVPRYVVLFDDKGVWHEAYSSAAPPPEELLLPAPLLLEKSRGQSHIASLGGTPYLLSAESYEDAGARMTLLIASPIDDRLFMGIQEGFPGRLVGLVSVNDDTLLASSNNERLPPGTSLRDLRREYVITGREYHDYGGAEMVIRLSSFMPAQEIQKMGTAFLRQERHKGLAFTAFFVVSLLLITLWVNRRVARLTGMVEEFSLESLGGAEQHLPSGDSLDILAERFTILRKEVLDSHQRVRSETRERTAHQLEVTRQDRVLSMLRSVTDAAGVGVMTIKDGSFEPANSLMRSWERQFETLSPFDVPYGHTEEKALVDSEGERRVFQLSCPLLFEGKKVLLVHDLTLERASEKEKALLRRELAQSQKLESVGRLAGGVAHDFNNILTVINGYAEMLLDELENDDPLRERVGVIFDSGTRGAELTAQLLAFSRRQNIHPVPLDLNETIERMRKILSRLIGEDIHVLTTRGADPAIIIADPGQIDQAVINLAINARDAMPDGGQLRIRTENVTVGEGSDPESTGMKPGEYVLLTFADTGTGMGDTTMERIFEPFFTTKETGKGTGLGLAMVYGMVKQSEGYIFVRSRPGAGSTFLIYLPCAGCIPESRPPSREEEQRGGNETILLAEDQKEVRTFIARTLARLGYGVLEAPNGREAWEIVKSSGTKIDLLLTDEVMPLMGGRELAALTRRESPGTRMIFMTGYAGEGEADHEISEEDAILQKPISMKRLARAVRAGLDRAGSAPDPSSSSAAYGESRKEGQDARGGHRRWK